MEPKKRPGAGAHASAVGVPVFQNVGVALAAWALLLRMDNWMVVVFDVGIGGLCALGVAYALVRDVASFWTSLVSLCKRYPGRIIGVGVLSYLGNAAFVFAGLGDGVGTFATMFMLVPLGVFCGAVYRRVRNRWVLLGAGALALLVIIYMHPWDAQPTQIIAVVASLFVGFYIEERLRLTAGMSTVDAFLFKGVTSMIGSALLLLSWLTLSREFAEGGFRWTLFALGMAIGLFASGLPMGLEILAQYLGLSNSEISVIGCVNPLAGSGIGMLPPLRHPVAPWLWPVIGAITVVAWRTTRLLGKLTDEAPPATASLAF